MIERAGNELRLSGPVTIANAVALCEEGKQQLNGDMVIDLAAVTEVDSTALSVLFEWRRAARDKNVHVSFRNLPDSMSSLAALYGVAELVAPDASPVARVIPAIQSNAWSNAIALCRRHSVAHMALRRG